MASGNGESAGSNQQPNPDALKWESLYDTAPRDAVEQQFRDDKSFIESKAKRPIEYSEKDAERDLAEREAIRDSAIEEIDAHVRKMQELAGRTDADYYRQHNVDFVGERNYNDKKGRARTFVYQDIYPNINQDKDFNEQTKRRTDLMALTEHIPMFDDESPEEYSKRVDQVYADFKRPDGMEAREYREEIDAADKDNRILLSLYQKMVPEGTELSQKVLDGFANIREMKDSGRFDEDRAKELQREVLQDAIDEQHKLDRQREKDERMEKLKERLAAKHKGEEEDKEDKEEKDKDKKEQEDKDKKEQEEKEKNELEEKEKRLRENERKIQEIDEQLEKLRQERESENSRIVEALKSDLENARTELDKWGHDLAESYAKNRRLIVGGKNRAEFAENKKQYSEALNKYLKIQAQLEHHKGLSKNGATIQSTRDALVAKLKAGELTVDEANQQLVDKWHDINKELRTGISAKFVESYIKEQKQLEDETIDRIDNGSLYRQIVSKIVNNKPLKVILTAAGVAGLAVTGVGLATGAVTLGLGYTAGGIALGAGKGALSGAIMSRQSSENSAVRGFVNERQIREQLEGIDAVNNGGDVSNVAKWLMNQYEAANKIDRSSNRRRTAIAMGLGAAIGGAMSGINLSKVVTEQRNGRRIIGYESADTRAGNLGSVDHARGTGTQQLFRELGGNGDSYYSSGAHDKMAEVISKYGMTVGENDWTYPGPISEWPEVAQEAFSEVANEWAKQGLVPAVKIGGQPVYDTTSYTVEKMVESKLINNLIEAARFVIPGAVGGLVGGRRNRGPNARPMPNLQPANEADGESFMPPFYERDAGQVTPGTPEQNTDTPQQAPEAPTQNTDTPQQPGDVQGSQINTQPGNPDTSNANFADATRAIFLDSVGEAGVDYMTSTEPYDAADGLWRNNIAAWWNSLDDNVKNDVLSYERSTSRSTYGQALRDWLSVQGVL